VFEPDMEIVRGRRHALPGDRAHGLLGHPGDVLEIQLVECVGQRLCACFRRDLSFLVIGWRRSHELVKWPSTPAPLPSNPRPPNIALGPGLPGWRQDVDPPRSFMA